MSFKKRRIDVTITLGTGTFGEQFGDTVTLRNHRVAFQAEYNGGVAQTHAQVVIYGLSLDLINRLTAIGPVSTQLMAQNKIQVDAGNEGETFTTVYKGSIMSAYGQFGEAPDVPLVIDAYAGMVAALKPVGASSYTGTVKAEDCMRDFANEANFAFENNGVSVALSNPYFSGTTLTKIKECAQSARINYTIDNDVLAIWPKNSYRMGDIPRISPDNGMIGYPEFGSQGISVKTLFRPEMINGGRFEIAGSLLGDKINKVWNVQAVIHTLETIVPNGAWFTEVYGFNLE